MTARSLSGGAITFSYAPIPSAADAAQDGDIIVVGAGTYGPVSVGPAVTIVSLQGPEKTVIDAQGEGHAVEIFGGGTLEGFTVVNGSSEDCAGILAENDIEIWEVSLDGKMRRISK